MMKSRPTLRILAPVLGFSSALVSCGGGSGPVPDMAVYGSVAFQTRQEIDAGVSALRSFIARDFTGDGIPDLLVASLADRAVRLLVASSAGGFSTTAGLHATFTTAPEDLAAGDFDNDGDLDFACLFRGAGIVRIFRNGGTGNMTEDPELLALGADAVGLTAGDLDGDGRGDLAVARAGHLRLFFGEGASFRSGGLLPAEPGSELAGTWAGDLNGDGRGDLAACDAQGDQIIVWYGGASGFSAGQRQLLPTHGRAPVAVIGHDITGDGLVDLVAANFGSSSLSIFAGNGRGNFHPPVVLLVDGNPIHVAVGPLGKERRPHLVVSHLDRAAIGVIASDGRGGFMAERQLGTSGLPTMSAVVDLDLDGSPDIVSTGLETSCLSWLRGTAAGELIGSELFAAAGAAPLFTVAADFDGDGRADVMVSDPDSGVCVALRGGAAGTLTVALVIPAGARSGSLAKSDVDRDGQIDVVVAVPDGLRYLINRSRQHGRLAFDLQPGSQAPPLLGGVGPFGVVTARLDADDTDDLAVADLGGNQVFVLLGNHTGHGFRAPQAPIPLSGGPLGIVCGRFDEDARPDLAVSRLGAGVVTILRGLGEGRFVATHDLSAGGRPAYVCSADFDGNGLDDLVVSDLAGARLVLYRTFVTGFVADDLAVGNGPTALLAEDLDRDGMVDLLVTSADSADCHVLLGDGRGSFPVRERFPGTLGAVSADLGDVDGDGRSDLVVASLWSHRVSLYLNKSR